MECMIIRYSFMHEIPIHVYVLAIFLTTLLTHEATTPSLPICIVLYCTETPVR